MDINLSSSTDFIIVTEKKINVSFVSISQISDNPVAKKVTAYIKLGNTNLTKTLTLWEGQDYDDIGQWTDLDAANRVKFLCENQ